MMLSQNFKLKASPEEGQSPQQKDKQRGKRKAKKFLKIPKRRRSICEGKIEEFEEPERYIRSPVQVNAHRKPKSV